MRRSGSRDGVQTNRTTSVVQPKRGVIERTFAWACINRRLTRDVERAAETVKAIFQIAMIKLMARRLCPLQALLSQTLIWHRTGCLLRAALASLIRLTHYRSPDPRH
jgi:hypothetical protein